MTLVDAGTSTMTQVNYVWWCFLFVGGTRLSRASIIRRRGYIPADGAPVANYVGEPCR